MSIEDAERWNNRYRNEKDKWNAAPRSLLSKNMDIIPEYGTALDIAMGVGTNSGLLINRGWSVVGVDISYTAVRMAKEKFPSLMGFVGDLTNLFLPKKYFDLIVNFYYLQRNLLAELDKYLKPGGLVFIETLSMPMRQLKSEIAPEYLLKEGELINYFSGWNILYYYEGWSITHKGGQKAISSLIAKLPL